MLVSQLFKDAALSREIKDKEVTNITDNSQLCREGSIYVCHKSGERYVEEALSKGAILVVSENKLCENSYITDDTKKNMQDFAVNFSVIDTKTSN